ncbi:MAG TPA: hypothetical protein ENK57_05950 [Polyangiaceae bacterium]|nr:hypothetical protein [Polyangiaceae bacterium]
MDEAALLTCMAYVDLNPVRAGLCERLDDADFTSVQARLAYAEARMDEDGGAKGAEGRACPAGLMPFADQVADEEAPSVPMLLSDYLELLDWTGRAVREGKGSLRGAPPAAIQRLSIEPERWLQTMSSQGLRRLGVLGTPEALEVFAATQGKRWVKGQGWARAMFRDAA